MTKAVDLLARIKAEAELKALGYVRLDCTKCNGRGFVEKLFIKYKCQCPKCEGWGWAWYDVGRRNNPETL